MAYERQPKEKYTVERDENGFEETTPANTHARKTLQQVQNRTRLYSARCVETSRRHCSLTQSINETFYSMHDDRSCNRTCERRKSKSAKTSDLYYRDSDRTIASF